MKLRQARKIVYACGHSMCRERCNHKVETLIRAMLRVGRSASNLCRRHGIPVVRSIRRSDAQ